MEFNLVEYCNTPGHDCTVIPISFDPSLRPFVTRPLIMPLHVFGPYGIVTFFAHDQLILDQMLNVPYITVPQQ